MWRGELRDGRCVCNCHEVEVHQNNSIATNCRAFEPVIFGNRCSAYRKGSSEQFEEVQMANTPPKVMQKHIKRGQKVEGSLGSHNNQFRPFFEPFFTILFVAMNISLLQRSRLERSEDPYIFDLSSTIS
jgi:hypothetical protein